MDLIDYLFTALCCLIGVEDRDYIIFSRDAESWQLVGWLHRN